MSELDLDAIRARAATATPGPWWQSDSGLIYGKDRYLEGYAESVGTATPGNEDFIAHAREDIPALLDEVDRLRRACRTIGHVMDHIYESLRPIIDAAGLGGLIDEDGDGDWELVWEKLQQRVAEAGGPDE